MHTFTDHYQNEVKLSFTYQPFSTEPKHVWVICRHRDRWLLTDHSRRGLEFPGGKVEAGETAEEAAIREVKEETGGRVSSIQYIGQYKVSGRGKTIIKNIYFAEIDELIKQETYFETNGPVLLNTLPKEITNDRRFSFIMKDNVLTYSLEHLKDKIKPVNI